MAAGALLARGITAVSLIFVTRWYSPSDLGVLALASSYVLMFGPLVSLRYSNAVPLARSNRSAAALAYLAIVFSVILSSAFFIALQFAPMIFPNALREPHAQGFSLALAVLVLSYALNDLMISINIRQKKLYRVAVASVLQSASAESAKISIGLGAHPSGLLLVVASILGNLVSVFYCAVASERRFEIIFNFRKQRLRRLIRVACSYRAFPIFRAPANVLVAVAAQLPVLYIARYHDLTDVGQYSLALALVSLPVALIGRTIAASHYSSMSGQGRRDSSSIVGVSRGLIVRLGLVAAPFALILWLLGPNIFLVIFGEQWHLAGFYAAALAPVAFAQLLQVASFNASNVLGSHRLVLWIGMQRALLTIIVFYLCHSAHLSSLVTIQVFAVILAVHYLIATLLVVRRGRQ